MGEVGGDYEEQAARYIQETKYPKPVIARITGIGAQNIFPRGSRMGHAGRDHRRGRFGTYESKVDAFEQAGVKVAKTSEELITFVDRVLPQRRQDFEASMSKEFELVSISKQKLENLKSPSPRRADSHALDADRRRNALFPRPSAAELMRQASIPQMIYEAITKEDDGQRAGRPVGQRFGALRHDQSDRRAGAGGGQGFVRRRLADERRRCRRIADDRRLGQQGPARPAARPLLARTRPTPWRWCRR